MMQNLYSYSLDGLEAVSFIPSLPFPEGHDVSPSCVLARQDPSSGPAARLLTDFRTLCIDGGVSWLDPRRISPEIPETPVKTSFSLSSGCLTAVNLSYPRWRDALSFVRPASGKKRVHLLAVGDVGGTLLTALKLLGGDVISTIGICDLDEKTVARWCAEMGQISWPWEYDSLPDVVPVDSSCLFDCDVFIFAAAKSIPPVGSGVRDVRMAQLEANRPLVERFALQARSASFGGLFVVLSDPVDQLCQAAWRASNVGPDGVLDYQGLLPEQVQGYGLGVMTARAAYFAKQDARFASYLSEGRSFGPHGKGLVIANSIRDYDDGLSQELTRLTLEANLRIRDLGFKPYVAPAVASGAMQLLLTLRGAWHCGSVPLGGVWFGVRNRFTPYGLELETLDLPDALYARLQETAEILRGVL